MLAAKKLLLAATLCGALWCAGATTVWGTPRAQQGRAAGAIQAGEVLVVLNEELLNALLEGMVSLPSPPTFQLSEPRKERAGPACANEVTLIRESMGTRTAVRFEPGRIAAPVAFRGSYEAALVGCLKFEGWADASLDLAFDQARQVLTARVAVKQVYLKNVPSLVGDGVTALVQGAIDKRVNPIELLRAEQLGARIPVSQGNALRLRAREVRHEIVRKELRLRIFYEVVRE